MTMKYFTGGLFLSNKLFALMASLMAIEGFPPEEMIDGGVQASNIHRHGNNMLISVCART